MASLNFGLNEVVKVYSGETASEDIFSGAEEIILDYSKEYLTYEILSGGTLVFEGVGNYSATTKVISYSKDGGETWTSVDAVDATEISVSAGDKVMFKGTNGSYATNAAAYAHITGTSEYNVYGNIMSLIYGDDFTGQTVLTENFALPSFFKDNNNLKSVRNLILPATTLTQSCYMNMFWGAGSITSGPKVLPAVTAATNCYSGMFKGCTSLLIAPEISVRTAASTMCNNMFSGCTSLVKVQDDIIINAAQTSCFNGTFKGCTSLKTAPAIRVVSAVSASSAFAGMFSGCTSLSFIYMKCNITQAAAYTNWVAGVAPKGIIFKNVVGTPSPAGWITYQGYSNFANQYFTIEASSEGEIWFNKPTGNDIEVDLEISVNNGDWYRIPYGSFEYSLSEGTTIKFRGRNAALATSDGKFAGFSGSTADFNVYGNIMSLLYGEDFLRQTGYTASYTFANLFKDAPVWSAGNLILPAVEPTPYCYANMFEGSSVTTPPVLRLYYPSEGCCKEMYKDCHSLYTTSFNITQTAERCCEGMFSGCTELTNGNVLGATALTPYCYANMFNGCTNLASLQSQALNVGEEGAEHSLDNWLADVASVGTFYKPAAVTYPAGASGIPEGWTIEDF